MKIEFSRLHATSKCIALNFKISFSYAHIVQKMFLSFVTVLHKLNI